MYLASGSSSGNDDQAGGIGVLRGEGGRGVTRRTPSLARDSTGIISLGFRIFDSNCYDDGFLEAASQFSIISESLDNF